MKTKKTPEEIKAAHKVAERAVCATGKKACKCGPKCECKELKKLEKTLVKAETAYHKATAKAAAACAAAKTAKLLIKEIKLAIKAQKAAIKASHKKRRGGIGDLDSTEA